MRAAAPQCARSAVGSTVRFAESRSEALQPKPDVGRPLVHTPTAREVLDDVESPSTDVLDVTAAQIALQAGALVDDLHQQDGLDAIYAKGVSARVGDVSGRRCAAAQFQARPRQAPAFGPLAWGRPIRRARTAVSSWGIAARQTTRCGGGGMSLRCCMSWMCVSGALRRSACASARVSGGSAWGLPPSRQVRAGAVTSEAAGRLRATRGPLSVLEGSLRVRSSVATGPDQALTSPKLPLMSSARAQLQRRDEGPHACARSQRVSRHALG